MHRVARWFRYDFVGSVFAVAFLCMSLTPSLLPRHWLLQALIGGISAAIGYGVGLFLLWLARAVVMRHRRRWVIGRRAWYWFGGVAGVLVIVMLIFAERWQTDIHHLMGVDAPPGYSYIALFIVAALAFAGLVGIGRLIRLSARKLGGFAGRWIPGWAARLTAVVVVTLLTIGIVNGVLIQGFFTVTDNMFATVNSETDPGVEAPTDPNRSGGPGSLTPWDSLGNQGRTFAAGGPTVADLTAFGVAQPVDPIRVYAGLDSAETTEERAALVVKELRRTGAFSRKLLCVITTTGTGWVDAAAIEPLEYMYGGDTALAGMQYSYLPSWISFLVDKERARDAGRELFNQVYDAWSELPENNRPKLVAFGESLGSFGAESAFSGAADMSGRTDGMLLVGPPNRNRLWREFVADREPGTPEILPVYDNGRIVRFAQLPPDLDQPAGEWKSGRVAYLQHPSDPIVWWTPRLLLHRPDWLEEPRGPDVLPAMRWFPFVTFWQVTADMAFSTGVPDGHGHNYGAEGVAAWAAVVPPSGWTAAQTEKLTSVISEKH
ncbi:alpha/beta-hydrolase family protein [Luedemannella flava]|uniref:Alpha/beta-hydrolase family protein n=1 Tax=Luedemannella flava TaxID=349316 RepID=A0ABN2M7J1_9ACTN